MFARIGRFFEAFCDVCGRDETFERGAGFVMCNGCGTDTYAEDESESNGYMNVPDAFHV